MYHILETHPELVPFEGDINLRMERYYGKRNQLVGKGGSLLDFANGHKWYGFHHQPDGWVYREWAPGADQVFLTGDFNNWQWIDTPLTRLDNGNWEVFLPGDTLHNGSRVITIVKKWEGAERGGKTASLRLLRLPVQREFIHIRKFGEVGVLVIQQQCRAAGGFAFDGQIQQRRDLGG